MSGGFDWATFRARALNPPRRLTDWRSYVPGAPRGPSSSHFLPSLSGYGFQQANLGLTQANRLFRGGDQARARQLRGQVVGTLLQDIRTRMPHLRQFTSDISYNRGWFTSHGSASRAVTTGGWADTPANPPRTFLNDSAFDSVNMLNRAVRHEIWHRIQRAHPQVFRNCQPLREYDAHLRDLENRHTFRISAAEKLTSLNQADLHLRRLSANPHWQTLPTVQQQAFVARWEPVRRDVCHELSSTALRTHPAYSRICGPQYNPLRNSGRGLRFGR